jgi:paraquat-inducible protein A
VRRSVVVGALLGLSLVLNVVSLCLPFVVVDAAGMDPVVYGLFGSVQMLLDAGMIVLAVLVVGFSIVFPFAKLAVIGWVWWHGASTASQRRALARVETLGKWSLFDVFLVAIMVAVTNDQWLISSTSLPGLTCFLAAIVVGMLAGEVLSARVPHDAPRAQSAPPSGIRLFLVLAVGGLLGAAMLVPFIQISDWRLIDRPYSLWDLVPALWQNGSAVLSLALGVFVLAIPALHWVSALAATLIWWRRPAPGGFVRVTGGLGRWSMLSVFALSLAVFLLESHYFLGTKPRHGLIPLFGCLALAFVGQMMLGWWWRRTPAQAPQG